jgi:hypothetical protein
MPTDHIIFGRDIDHLSHAILEYSRSTGEYTVLNLTDKTQKYVTIFLVCVYLVN